VAGHGGELGFEGDGWQVWWASRKRFRAAMFLLS
jgi:hypothetical protein